MPQLRVAAASWRNLRRELQQRRTLVVSASAALGAPHAMVAILKDPEDELPEQPEFMSLSQPVVVVGGLAYTAAHKPVRQDGTLITGRADSEQGRTAARLAALSMLASVKRQLGSLDRVRRVVRLHAMVNCAPDFTGHILVCNGAAELFMEVWGEEAGVGACSAVGATSLPGNVPVQLEAVFELEDAAPPTPGASTSGVKRPAEGPPYNRPRGKAPKGKMWDSQEGQWVQDPEQPVPEEKPKRPRGRPPGPKPEQLPQAVAAGAGAAEVMAAVDAVGVAADGLEYAQAETMAVVIADEEAPVAEQEGGPVVENVDD